MHLSNSELNKTDRNINELIFVDEINFHDVTYLKQRIYLEKRRAERSHYTFSVILINWAGLYRSDGKQNQIFDISQILQKILSHICSNIRETDVVSLLDDSRIIILLPDATNAQAEQVFSRIKLQLMSYPKLENPITKIMDSSNICILTYPFETRDELLGNHLNTRGDSTTPNMDSLISKLMRRQNNYFLELNSLLSYGLNFNMNGNSLIMSRIKCFEMKLMSEIEQQLQRLLKRIIDIIGAIIGITVTSPIMVFTVLLIKITSPGPILFKQQRIGYKGKKFIIFKFRSMRKNASNLPHKDYIVSLVTEDSRIKQNEDNVAKYKHQIDHRITKIGRFIRKTSIDELPQLLNVLLGNMSLVGPRPHPVYEVELYKNWYYRRLLVKPGLTGLSKLNLRCTPENYEEAMRYDIRYVDQWSLKEDLKIIFKTIPSLFMKNGAY